MALIFAYTGALLVALLALPQVRATVLGRQTEGVSVVSWSLQAATCLTFLIYGIRTVSHPQVVGNVLPVIGAGAIVVVIPDIGGTLVTRLSELPTNEAVNREAWEARSRAYDDYNARHPNASKWMQKTWAYGQDLAREFEGDDAFMRVYDGYSDKMVAQVRFGHNVTRISPTTVYRRAVEAAAGSGIDHYESFIKQVREYKLTLRDFLLGHYPLDIHRPHDNEELLDALSTRTFTAAEIPFFRNEPISMEDSMKNSLWDVAILFLFNIVVFMAAHISFLYQDIK